MERLLRDPRTTDSPPVLGIAGYFTEPASPEAGWALLRILVIVAIAGTPLLLWPGLLLSHDVMPKVILLSWTAALLLLTLPRWVHRPERLFYGLMALEVASLLLSAAFSTRPGLSFAGTVWRRFGVVEQTAVLVIAMAAAGFASDRWKLVLFRAMSVTGAVGASYGIAQYFGFDPFLDQTLYAIPYFGGIVRPPATMGHAIYFASWLVPVTLLAGWSAAGEVSLWRRVHTLAALLGTIAVLLSGTRGAVLALAAGVLLFLLRERRLRKALIWAMPAFLLFAAGFALTPPGKRFSNRLYQWKQDPGGPRAMLWKQTPQLFLAHPLAGTGPETFAIEFRKIESAEMSRAYPDFYHETPHNVFLDAAVAQGVPGILVLAGLLWITARTGHSGLQAALTGIWVSSLFASFTLMEWLLLWTLAGLARPGSGGRIQLPQWAATIAGIAGFVIAASAYLLTVPDIEGQRLLRAVARKDQAAAYRACDLARSNGFGLPGYQLFFSRQLAILGRSLGNTPKAQVAWRTSAEFAARAEIESEEPFAAALQSGVVAVTFGDLTRAEEKARESIQLAPNWYQPHLFLASVLEVMGRTQEARAERAAGERLRH